MIKLSNSNNFNFLPSVKIKIFATGFKIRDNNTTIKKTIHELCRKKLNHLEKGEVKRETSFTNNKRKRSHDIKSIFQIQMLLKILIIMFRKKIS